MFQPHAPKAFTLIELLVVVTIIVVLLALLTPALQEATYQAELLVCQTRLHAGTTGVIGYAIDYKRSYPVREGARNNLLQWTPDMIANRDYDERPPIFERLAADLLLDPFCAKLDLVNNPPNNNIFANYSLWFGWRFQRETGPKRGMYRLGDAFTYENVSYRLLMSDTDRLLTNQDQSTHPDRDGVMIATPAWQDVVNPHPFWNLQGVYVTISYWYAAGTGVRGPLDLNYAYDDGSVLRFDRVLVNDPDMDQIGDHSFDPDITYPMRQVPRR